MPAPAGAYKCPAKLHRKITFGKLVAGPFLDVRTMFDGRALKSRYPNNDLLSRTKYQTLCILNAPGKADGIHLPAQDDHFHKHGELSGRAMCRAFPINLKCRCCLGHVRSIGVASLHIDGAIAHISKGQGFSWCGWSLWGIGRRHSAGLKSQGRQPEWKLIHLYQLVKSRIAHGACPPQKRKNISQKNLRQAFRFLEVGSIKQVTGQLVAGDYYQLGGAMARPLDKIVKGKRLTRDPAIEAAIDVALGQDLNTLRTRAAVNDTRSPDYLPSECLVHLIRNAIRQSNAPPTHSPVANALLPFLLKRCEANLQRTVLNRIATAQDLRDDILAHLALMFANEAAPDGKYRLDFYEVKFNRSFKLLRIDFVRAELTRLNRLDKGKAPSEEEPEDALAEISIEEIGEKIAAPGSDPVEGIFRQQMRPRLIAAVKALPENERKAFVLRYVLDYQVEDENDPTTITVATLCNTTGRTIRNRLKRAKAKLAAMLKEAK